MKRMKNIIILIMAVVLTACGTTAETWQDHYDLGMRYLSEGNYEEAIVAFNAAIEIDPKQPDIYISLTEAYLYAGDYEKAIETLENGYKATNDDRLQKEFFDFSEWIYDSVITSEELTIGGTPFYNMNVYDTVAAYPSSGSETVETDDYGSWYQPHPNESGFISNMSFFQEQGFNELYEIWYAYSDDHATNKQYQPEFRNVILGTSAQEVLRNIGLSDLGVTLAEKVFNNKNVQEVILGGSPDMCIERHENNNDRFSLILTWWDNGVSADFVFENGVLSSLSLYNDSAY